MSFIDVMKKTYEPAIHTLAYKPETCTQHTGLTERGDSKAISYVEKKKHSVHYTTYDMAGEFCRSGLFRLFSIISSISDNWQRF